ncbi:hypothetical protein OQA88_10983 [Cercophora sp. LCS_1]
MGITGVGKSTFIEKVTGLETGVGHSLNAHTRKAGIYAYQPVSSSPDNNRCVYLVDTPGFDDTTRTDSEVLKEIAFFLAQIHRKRVRLSGVIYLHRINDTRVGGSTMKNLRMFKQLCGEAALDRVTLTTSMWENVKPKEIGERREKELLETDEFWGAMYRDGRGCRVARWEGDLQASARQIVGQIIDRPGQTVLKIQYELDHGNPSLDSTSAGREVIEDITVEGRRLKDEMARLREHQRQERDDFARQLSDANDARESLKISLETLVQEKTAQYEKILSDMKKEQKELSDALQETRDELASSQNEWREEEEDHQRTKAKYETSTAQLRQQHTQLQLAPWQQEALRRKLQLEVELQRKLAKERKDDEMAAMMEQRRIRAKILKNRNRIQSAKMVMGFVALVAGVAATGAGIATGNPIAITTGAAIVGTAATVIKQLDNDVVARSIHDS